MKKELDVAVRLVITKQKKEGYDRQYYDLGLELEIAEELEDERLKDTTLKNLVRIKKAIKLLETKIGAMEKEIKDLVSE